MLLKKKKTKGEAEVPSSSLADIAFLLLIFFLVVTTIDVDTGIGLVLPPLSDEPPPPIRERNMLKILVNNQGLILINESPAALRDVKDLVIRFVDNNGEDEELSESPQMAIVSIKTDRNTPYDIYIDMLDEVMGAYRELRDAEARVRGFRSYEQYKTYVDERGLEDEIREMYPQKISEAEPDPGV